MRGALTLNQSQTDKSQPIYEFKIIFDFFMTVLFVVCDPIINVAFFALPFPCEYVGACYGRSVTLSPLSKQKKKRRRSSRLTWLILSNKGFMHH